MPAAALRELTSRSRRRTQQRPHVVGERLEIGEHQLEDIESNKLVARFQRGDQSAFEALYLRYFDRVYGYLCVALRDPDEAEDLAQHVFMCVLTALPSYEIRPGMPFRGWLFRIARNALLNALPRQRRMRPEDPARLDERRDVDIDGGLSTALGWLSDGDIYAFVDRLPLTQKQVIVMRYMLDLTTADIAAALERTPKAVRQLQARAFKTLEERLKATGRHQPGLRRAAMLIRLRPAPVLAARRFVLGMPGARRAW